MYVSPRTLKSIANERKRRTPSQWDSNPQNLVHEECALPLSCNFSSLKKLILIEFFQEDHSSWGRTLF